MKIPQVLTETVVLKGGLDQVTPTLSLAGGVCSQSLNFECGITGGYTRIEGYERYDGQASPSGNSLTFTILSVSAVTNAPTVADTLTSSGGATGEVAWIDTERMAVCQVSGTFATGETVSVGASLVGTLDSVGNGPETPLEMTKISNAVADIYRADIGAIPGSGVVRGVVEYEDVVYGFRDNVGGTAVDIYKSSSSGWVNVPMFETVAFTSGGAVEPSDGDTLTQGGVTATIKRVVRTEGVWTSSTALGNFIITTPSGGSFSAGAATIGVVNVTITGAEAAITIPVGGKYEFVEYNFAGQQVSKRIYGVNGVGTAFEFDGETYVPIATESTTDTPKHLSCYKGYLVLSIGSSLIGSVAGTPYSFDGGAGAWEIATGDTITATIVMAGTEAGAALGVTSRDNTGVLYGSEPSDFNYVSFDTGTGSVDYSAQNMTSALMYDDRGATMLRAAQDYGNFSSTMLTSKVLPFVNGKIGQLSCSTVSRRKSQYRLFFDDGYGLYITIVNGKLVGCMPTYFTNPANCAYEGKNQGDDVMYVGSDDGYVYQLDKGTSFDGEVIDYMLQLVYAPQDSPRQHKRYRKAAVEIYANTGVYSEFFFNHVLGYSSVEYSQPVDLNQNSFIDSGRWNTNVWGDYAQFLQNGRWDTLTWDQFFYDISNTAPVECELDGTAENISMIFYGTSDYVGAFTINSILLHYSLRRMMR